MAVDVLAKLLLFTDSAFYLVMLTMVLTRAGGALWWIMCLLFPVIFVSNIMAIAACRYNLYGAFVGAIAVTAINAVVSLTALIIVAANFGGDHRHAQSLALIYGGWGLAVAALWNEKHDV